MREGDKKGIYRLKELKEPILPSRTYWDSGLNKHYFQNLLHLWDVFIFQSDQIFDDIKELLKGLGYEYHIVVMIFVLTSLYLEVAKAISTI